MTNADKIRAMTDERMAQWLTFLEGRILEKQPKMPRAEMFEEWLDWLKQEAEE